MFRGNSPIVSLPLLLTLILVGLLVVRIYISGLRGPLVTRLRRVLNITVLPLLVVFMFNTLTTISQAGAPYFTVQAGQPTVATLSPTAITLVSTAISAVSSTVGRTPTPQPPSPTTSTVSTGIPTATVARTAPTTAVSRRTPESTASATVEQGVAIKRRLQNLLRGLQ